MKPLVVWPQVKVAECHPGAGVERLSPVLAPSFQEISANQLRNQFPPPASQPGPFPRFFFPILFPVLPMCCPHSPGAGALNPGATFCKLRQPRVAPARSGHPRGARMGMGLAGGGSRNTRMLRDPGLLQCGSLFKSKTNSRCEGVIIPFIYLFIPPLPPLPHGRLPKIQRWPIAVGTDAAGSSAGSWGQRFLQGMREWSWVLGQGWGDGMAL